MLSEANFSSQAPLEVSLNGYAMTLPSRHPLLAFLNPKSPGFQPYRETGLVKVAQALQALLVARKTETLRRGWKEVPAWVFCSRRGGILNDANVRRAFNKVLRKAKLPSHFTPHCLRHTFASLLLQAGKSPAYVQRQLGHASIQLTVDTYGKWLPMGNKSAVDRLDDPIPALQFDRNGSKAVAEAGKPGRRADAKCLKSGWSRRSDLNRGPAVYETAALPTELRRRCW